MNVSHHDVKRTKRVSLVRNWLKVKLTERYFQVWKLDYINRFVKWYRIWTGVHCLLSPTTIFFFFLLSKHGMLEWLWFAAWRHVTQSRSLIFTTWLEILYSTEHAPSNKKRDFGHWLVEGGQGQGIKISENCMCRGNLSGPLEMALTLWGWFRPKSTFDSLWPTSIKPYSRSQHRIPTMRARDSPLFQVYVSRSENGSCTAVYVRVALCCLPVVPVAKPLLFFIGCSPSSSLVLSSTTMLFLSPACCSY